MLKCEVTHDRGSGATVALETCGSLADQILDTLLLVGAVYSSLTKHDPETGNKYRMVLLMELLDPKSQAWIPQDSKSGTITSIKIPKGGKSDD